MEDNCSNVKEVARLLNSNRKKSFLRTSDINRRI